MSRILTFSLTLGLALPATALAQEQDDDGPGGVLSISSWQCPQASIGDIAEAYDTYTRPVEDQMIVEGKMMGAGLYFHAWADEWNVNYYRIAPTMDGLLAAVAEVGERVVEANPELADDPGPFAVCTAHKDNLYFMGPTTQAQPSGN